MLNHEALDRVLAESIAAGAIPGVVAVAATADGDTYAAAFGTRDLSTGDPMTPDTVLRIASMTKVVTAVAALQLVEQGKLALDEPLGGLLPYLSTPRVLDGFDGSGQPILRPAVQPITLRRLLTHTSGFGYDLWNANLFRYQRNIAVRREDKMGTLGAPLAFEPGTRWGYGIGIDWAGQAVEAAGGQSLGDYLHAHIFAPLGMTDTGFTISAPALPRFAALHQRNDDGTLTAQPVQPPRPPVFHGGGGGLYSTGPDYLRFLRALLHGGALDGAPLLGAESMAGLFTNQIGELTVQPFVSQNLAMSNNAELLPGMVKKWSLGGIVNPDDAPTGRRAGSLSWCGIFNSYYWVDRDAGVAGAIFTQILPFLDPPVLALAEQFERTVYAAA